MRVKLYEESVLMDPETEATIKRVFVNHLLVYNLCLEYLQRHNEVTFYDLKKRATEIIAEKNIAPVVMSALLNELYYQYKKFSRQVKMKKTLTGIQYFTFTVSSVQNNNFTVGDDHREMEIVGLPGKVRLPSPIPEIGDYDTIYFNLSYSNQENGFRLTIYAS